MIYFKSSLNKCICKKNSIENNKLVLNDQSSTNLPSNSLFIKSKNSSFWSLRM